MAKTRTGECHVTYINQRRIQQLGEVICFMKHTENELDSKQILSVIERYNKALILGLLYPVN